jgi:hypothetical protein
MSMSRSPHKSRERIVTLAPPHFCEAKPLPYRLIQATTANPPQIEVVRVKPIDPAAPNLRFQLSDGSVDLMKSFTLDGFDGVGGAWKMPPTDETFDARYGRW